MNDMILHIQQTEINLSGLIVGLYSFFNIIIARRACIMCEYHFGKQFWIVFLIIGLLLLPFSLITANTVISSILGITGFTYLWGIHEIIEQEERVKKGWYPRKLTRKN